MPSLDFIYALYSSINWLSFPQYHGIFFTVTIHQMKILPRLLLFSSSNTTRIMLLVVRVTKLGVFRRYIEEHLWLSGSRHKTMLSQTCMLGLKHFSPQVPHLLFFMLQFNQASMDYPTLIMHLLPCQTRQFLKSTCQIVCSHYQCSISMHICVCRYTFM